MIAHLEWVNDWLILVVGPWRLAVADIEAHWSLHGKSGENSQEIGCASVEEGREIVRAMLALRGVSVP